VSIVLHDVKIESARHAIVVIGRDLLFGTATANVMHDLQLCALIAIADDFMSSKLREQGCACSGAVSRSASDAVNSKLATIASMIALVVGAGVLLSGFGVALPVSFSLA
jgi:hypothetical protein